jgi:hypothetical protein
MPWWCWLLLGLALLGFETLTPGGFYFLFFGVASLLLGTLAGAGAGGPVWFQWLLFSALSVASLLLFRGPLLARMSRQERAGEVDSLIGEIAIVQDDLPPGETGKAEMRGTSWSVRNADQHLLRRGQRCKVERVQGLTLWVRGE